ncbi:MAG TPA: glycosyltransferase [Candidatus Kapabacteria bacterium]|nr:glycosyltransferase [Candidatus Kapabacteria bacterium]
MDNELIPQDAAPETEPAPNPSAPRDIIAERMAARRSQQPERPVSSEPAPMREAASDSASESSEESSVETDGEPMLPFEAASEDVPVPKLEVKPRSIAELSAELSLATAAVEAPAEEISSETKSADTSAERAPRPERGERRERRDRGPRERSARPDREKSDGERRERPSRTDRESRPDRPARSDRPERRERPERTARPDFRNSGPKTPENAFARARALATREGVSVVVPLYNEQESLRELTAAIRDELFKLCEKNYEVIFINDGSTDRSGDILKDISEGSSRVTVLTFRSNLGKSAALATGFKEAKNGIVITMDADLQDDPKEFVNLIAKLDEGFDLVTGWKKKRNDPMSKTAPSKLFNSVTSFFSGLKLHDFNCGLKAYRKAVTDSLDVYGEMHRYLPALAHWQGFRVAEIPVLHHPRKFGKSKFGTSRFFKGFLDLLTIIFTNRYGRRPLHFFGTIGTILSLIGFGINIYVSIEWARGLTTLSNRPILLLGILLILVGVQLISIGLLGEMMVKNSMRPSEAAVIRSHRKPRPRPTQSRDRRKPE